MPAAPAPIPAYAVTTAQPKRSRLALSVGATGVAALLLVGVLVVRGAQGRGTGAGSADELVHRLESAINHKDPAAALALLAPDELPSLGDVYATAIDKLKSSQDIDVDGAKPALDIRMHDVVFDSAALGSTGTYAKLTFHQGSIDYATHPDRLPAGIKARAQQNGGSLPAPESGTKTVKDLQLETDNGTKLDPFFLAVKENGRWYVSLTMTAGEYAAESQGLAGGDFDIASPPGSPASTPEEAVRQLAGGGSTLFSTSTAQIDKLTALLPEGETRALRVYHRTIKAALDRARGTADPGSADTSDTGSSIDPSTCDCAPNYKLGNLSVSSHAIDADHSRVRLDGLDITSTYHECDYSSIGSSIDSSSGSGTDTGSFDTGSFDTGSFDNCTRTTVTETIHWDGRCITSTRTPDTYDEGTNKSCLNDHVTAEHLAPQDFGITDVHLVTKRERGGWVVDPVATLLDYGRTALTHLDDAKVKRLLGHEI